MVPKAPTVPEFWFRKFLGSVFAWALVLSVAPGLRVDAQKISADDLAARMTGAWTINLALSPSFRPPGRSGSGRSGGGRAYGAAHAVGGFALQRGRGVVPSEPNSGPTPSGPGDLTPEERAERAAMHVVEELAPAIAIAATADAISFTDQRGVQSCAINGKSAKVILFEARIDLKCRWDKDVLRQEVSSVHSKLTRTWGVDGNGRLVVRSRIETFRQPAIETTAVFDKSGDRGSGIGDRGSGTGDRGPGTGDRGPGIGDRGSGIGG